MKILIVQSEILSGRTADNLSHVEGLLNTSEPGVDVIVLPELFATGFRTIPTELAADAPLVVEWMLTVAAHRGAAVAGSVVVADGGSFVNRLYFVTPDGSVQYYDKRHLFGYGGETLHFTRGHRRVVVSYGGMRFLLQVCYDLRFPVFSRCHHDYDAIINVANWPSGRQEAWDTLLRARAIENQCFVIGVNRVGAEGRITYSGGSVVIDYLGHTLCSCDPGSEQLVTAELRPHAQQTYRREFPVLDDADSFSLRLDE